MNDPNQDLVGYEFETEEGRWKVVGTPSWSSGQHVEIRMPEKWAERVSTRSAELIRLHKRRAEQERRK